MSAPELILRELGLADYQSTLTAMRQLTDSRVVDSPDELWLLQHSAVFTQGQAGKAQHILAPGDIPIIRADRGGQVTYHGPGQWVLYFMVDLRRGPLSVRDLVNMMERCVLQLLEDYMISAALKPGAPGVYVADEKIASLGLRIRRGCSYHGLALNVDMDLEPFGRINPCGYEGLQVISMAEQLPGVGLKLDVIGRRLMNIAASMLSI